MDDTSQPMPTPPVPQEIPQTPPVDPVLPPQTPVTPVVETPPAVAATPQMPPVVPAAESKKGHGMKALLIVFLAVVLLGGGGAGIYFGMNSMTPEPTPTPMLVQAAPEPEPELTLNLTSPTVETVASGKMLVVSGTTLPNTPVAMMTEEFDNTVVSDETGMFTGEIELADGVNILVVTVLGEDGQEKSVTQEVVYDDQVLGVNTEDPTTKVKPIKKVVKNDLETIKKNYKVDDSTKYADEKNKPVGAASVKPNDKTVAIIEDTTAVKIFVRNASESAQIRMTRRRAVQGVVVKVDESTVYLTHQVQRERQYSVMYNEQTVVKMIGAENPTIADITAGQRVIAIGNVTETNDLVATRIMVIPGAATGVFDKQPVTPFPTITISPSLTPEPEPSLTPTITPTE